MKEEKFNSRTEYNETTNSSVFKKTRKKKLASSGEIRCSRCPYNRGENEENKFYGKIGAWKNNGQDKYRNPSWKLTSKNPKQWMCKNIKVKVDKSIRWDGIEFEWIEIKF
jgi:hypothetical protein